MKVEVRDGEGKIREKSWWRGKETLQQNIENREIERLEKKTARLGTARVRLERKADERMQGLNIEREGEMGKAKEKGALEFLLYSRTGILKIRHTANPNTWIISNSLFLKYETNLTLD